MAILLISNEDKTFRSQVEICELPTSEFDHRAHLRLAYIYLVENNPKNATLRMRNALIGLLKHAGVEPIDKYHETLTEAWVLAVSHFMNNSDTCQSANEFIEKNPEMLDSKIMLTHYSAEVLFSSDAQQSFIEPNLQAIPRYR